MILERLLAIQELRKETRRLEGEWQAGSNFTISVGWRDQLAEGFEIAVEDAESDDYEGELSGRERREHVERMRCLSQVIRDAAPDCALSVSPAYDEELLGGLRGALRMLDVKRQLLSKHDDSHGAHFIAGAQVVAMYEYILTLEDLMESGSTEG